RSARGGVTRQGGRHGLDPVRDFLLASVHDVGGSDLNQLARRPSFCGRVLHAQSLSRADLFGSVPTAAQTTRLGCNAQNRAPKAAAARPKMSLQSNEHIPSIIPCRRAQQSRQGEAMAGATAYASACSIMGRY